jgi:hypothetical protein
VARDEAVATTFGAPVRRDVSAPPAAVDDELARCYPGDPGDSGTRRPVHTVYVPADALTGETVRAWGDMIDAAEGRVTGLHHGAFDHSAACGVGRRTGPRTIRRPTTPRR